MKADVLKFVACFFEDFGNMVFPESRDKSYASEIPPEFFYWPKFPRSDLFLEQKIVDETLRSVRFYNNLVASSNI